MKTKTNLSLKPFEDALETLRKAVERPPASELERDGVIQRFEYSFEMAWKSIRAVLAALGRAEVSGSPRPLLRDAHQEGWIQDLDEWFRFLDARNESTHSYHQLTANEVHQAAIRFPKAAGELLGRLKDAIS